MVLTLLLALGCAQRSAVVRAPVPMEVSVAAVRDQLDARQVVPLPDALMARIIDQLTARDLTPQVVDTSALAEVFSRQRTTARRLEVLATDGAPLVLLVEAQAQYTAQISGRLRWTVQVHLSLDPADSASADSALAEITETEFTVPVSPHPQHQRADDALHSARGQDPRGTTAH